MKKLAIILLSALTLSSCESFLEEDNKAGITNDELYVTAIGYETLRVNAYNSLRTIYNDGPKVMLAGTDLYQMARGVSNDGLFDYRSLYDTNGDVETFYTNCYNSLQAVNAAEYYLANADLDDTTKQQYQGEYDFMKGFLHFILLEEFGGVVISDEYTQDVRLNMPRASLEETYNYIIEKLEAAEASNMPQTPPTSDEGQTSYGQICKDIVEHYLAKAYLTRGWDLGNAQDFETAKTYAQGLINRRGSLQYDFETLWSPSNENNNEFIFSIQYDANSITGPDQGNNQEALFGCYLGGSERNHKYMAGDYVPSWSLHSWYTKDDARYDATFMLTIWERYYDYYNGRNIPGTNSIAAIYPRAWDRSQEMFDDYVAIVGISSTAENTFTDAINLTDPEVVAQIMQFIKKWCPEYENVDPVNLTNANGENMMRVYPFIENSSDRMVNESFWRSGYNSDFCQPNIKKFDMDHLATFHTNQSYRDIVLATLSETMFLYAEACIGLNQYSEAEDMINDVLARPGNNKNGGAPLTITLPTSQEEALEVYLQETGKELVGQYCGRWPELRRTKMLKFMFYKYNYDYLTGNLGSDPIGDKLYRPIPQAAIEINEGLAGAQNPGY
ncbi:RagB/SusD family nutrient uptake outer membrane protein [Phocaeicola salanitronis]|uniref:RagB/SusD family nutrient uptake outer membrane protein n=1 Tax=Phocaeicola salanitronis TaxID=376805 RepID=UPI0023F92C48|nr:RagB/SusD family nutrient uptake outer membrane protein [Phocaeicola salanitronis]